MEWSLWMNAITPVLQLRFRFSKKVNARYVYGVTAPPKRGDNLEKIIHMLLGPIRHSYTAKKRAMEQGIGHYVYPRYTRVIDISLKIHY